MSTLHFIWQPHPVSTVTLLTGTWDPHTSVRKTISDTGLFPRENRERQSRTGSESEGAKKDVGRKWRCHRQGRKEAGEEKRGRQAS